MEYKIKKMPIIALGTWEITDPNVISKILPAAFESGYIHIDTAQIYFNEEFIGDTLSKLNVNRLDYWLTTKIMPFNFKYHAYDSIKSSLARLKTKYVDAILLHASAGNENNLIAYKEAMKARDEGLVRFIGVSNFSIDEIEYIFQHTGEYPKYNQIIASVIQRVQKLEKYCKEKDITLMGYSSIRPYYNPNSFYNKEKDNPAGLTENEKKIIDDLANKYETTPANILQKYVLDSDYVILPKSSNPERVKDNIKVLDLHLSKDDYSTLEKMCRFSDADWLRAMQTFSSLNIPDEIAKIGGRVGPESDKSIINYLKNRR